MTKRIIIRLACLSPLAYFSLLFLLSGIHNHIALHLVYGVGGFLVTIAFGMLMVEETRAMETLRVANEVQRAEILRLHRVINRQANRLHHQAHGLEDEPESQGPVQAAPLPSDPNHGGDGD
jgi:hypothetical protein